MGRPLLLLTAAALAPSPWTASSGCGPCFFFRLLSSPLYLGRPPHGCGPCSFSRLQPLPHQLGPPSHGCGPCFLLWLQPLPPLLGVPPHGITYGRPLAASRLYATATPAMALTSPGTSALGSPIAQRRFAAWIGRSSSAWPRTLSGHKCTGTTQHLQFLGPPPRRLWTWPSLFRWHGISPWRLQP